MRMNRSNCDKNIASKSRQVKFTVVGAHHKESTWVQEFRTFRDKRHQVFSHVEVKALETRKTRRVQHNAVKAEPLLFCPMHILYSITSEKLSWTQIKSVQRIIFAALVQNFPADIGIRCHRSTTQPSMHRKTTRITEQIKESQCTGIKNIFEHRTEAIFNFETNMTHVKEKSRINRIHQIDMELCLTFTHNAYSIFTRAHYNVHRSVFKRSPCTRKAFLHNNANRVKKRY